jgi:hypothetical protein
LAATAWGVIALFIFLLGSPIVPRPAWYSIVTYVLENVAMLGAAILCFRNWGSSQIVSGRIVWLLIGLGTASYFIANFILGWWELVWGLSPNVSPADFFYLLTYVMLGTGMLMAVVSRRLNLTSGQWGIVVGIAIAGIAIAYFVSYAGTGEEEAVLPNHETPYLEQSVEIHSGAIATHTTDWINQSPSVGNQALILAQTPAPAENPELDEATSSVPESNAPGWVIALEVGLDPYADIVALLYVVGDIFLVVMATMLLLAFWGGRFSMSWRFIAAAAFSFYIADMWFAYAIERFENYETGALPEVFWVFSGVLFSIGAALEYNLSTRSRRSIRRRA